MQFISEFQEIAKKLDADDALSAFRSYYAMPENKIYLCSNSLGLPVKKASELMQMHLRKWSEEGAHGWFSGDNNWYTSFDRKIRELLASILGAKQDEVVVMNSLTINLHLLLTSFFQPTRSRYKILVDAPLFPSDLYAIKSHLNKHGFDPDDALIIVKPRENEDVLREDDIEDILRHEGESIALVFLNSVNYLTGQAFNIAKLVSVAHKKGCLVGLDLAHSAGNIMLSLHADVVDFAVGCSYKYLCSGPGGPGFAYVHAKHHTAAVPRLAGWWGDAPDKRFINMDSNKNYANEGDASSWQVSTPSILAMLPLIASLEVINKAGMPAIRKKSEQQTEFLIQMLERCVREATKNQFRIVTPRSTAARGSQLSIKVNTSAEECVKRLFAKNIICDHRPPNIIRVTPHPLYTTYQELVEFVKALCAS